MAGWRICFLWNSFEVAMAFTICWVLPLFFMKVSDQNFSPWGCGHRSRSLQNASWIIFIAFAFGFDVVPVTINEEIIDFYLHIIGSLFSTLMVAIWCWNVNEEVAVLLVYLKSVSMYYLCYSASKLLMLWLTVLWFGPYLYLTAMKWSLMWK